MSETNEKHMPGSPEGLSCVNSESSGFGTLDSLHDTTSWSLQS